MATNLSVRLDDGSEATLDELVRSVAAFYESQGLDASAITRSSALRALLLAWRSGRVEQFVPPA